MLLTRIIIEVIRYYKYLNLIFCLVASVVNQLASFLLDKRGWVNCWPSHWRNGIDKWKSC